MVPPSSWNSRTASSPTISVLADNGQMQRHGYLPHLPTNFAPNASI